MEEEEINIYGGIAVVDGLVTLKAQYAEKKTSGDFGSLLMWPELGGRWQLVANQLTSTVK